VAVAVSGTLETILASGQQSTGIHGWQKLPSQTENSVVLFTEAVGGVKNESCQFTVPFGWTFGCSPIIPTNSGWRFPGFTANVSAGTTPVISGNLTPYGNTANSAWGTVFDFLWLELAWPTPAAPTGLMATTISPTEIDLSWTNPSTGGLTDNHVYQSVGAGCTSPTPIDPNEVTESYMATGLAPDTQFSFYVTASNVSGESPPSNCATNTTFSRPPAPTDLVVTSPYDTQAYLTWVNPPGPLTDSYVNFSVGSGCGSPSEVDVGSVVTSFTVTSLAPGTLYSFEVSAANSTGQGPPSTCVDQATLANIPPTLVLSGVTSTTFTESWTNGTWGNVTEVKLIIANDSVTCQSAGALSSSWTWAVSVGPAVWIQQTGGIVAYEFNDSQTLNFTFNPFWHVWVGLWYETSGSFANVTTCQQVAFAQYPPPPPGPDLNIFPFIIAGLVGGIILIAVTQVKKNKKWWG